MASSNYLKGFIFFSVCVRVQARQVSVHMEARGQFWRVLTFSFQRSHLLMPSGTVMLDYGFTLGITEDTNNL